MFENVDGRTDDGRTDDGVTGILIAHLGAFCSGELKRQKKGSESSYKAMSECPKIPVRSSSESL